VTDHRTRREFMGLAAAGVAGAFAPSILGASSPAFDGRVDRAVDPDLVVINAKVYTMETAAPRAEAFAVSSGRIVAVGASAQVRSIAGRRARVIDAKGMTVIPGFIDTHNHPDGTTLLYEVLVGNPFEVEFVSIDSIITKLREKARSTPPGMWVEGFFHDDTKLKDKRRLTVRGQGDQGNSRAGRRNL